MITKLGTDYFKGQKQDIFLLAATCSKDGELKSTQSGKYFAACSCKAIEKEDGTAVWITVKSFSEQVRDRIARIEKGAPFLAWGRVEKREYNGQEYTDMLADGFLCGPVLGSAALPEITLSSPMTQFAPTVLADDFEDGELPF